MKIKNKELLFLMRKRIKEKKLTQEEFARELDVSLTTLNRWLNERVEVGRAWAELIILKLK